MSAKAEAKELAYQTYVECGQNLSETERKLNGDRGLPVSRQTLTEWKQKYDWEGRAARAEACVARISEGSSEASFLTPLIEQKERYETYFRTLPLGKIDNQALYAYSTLLKTIVDLSPKDPIDTPPAAETMREIRTEEDAVKALEDSLEMRLNGMLSNPASINLKAIKDVKQSMDLLRDLRERINAAHAEGNAEKVIDAEKIKRLREQLGL